MDMNETIKPLANGDFEVMPIWEKLPTLADYDTPTLDAINEAVEEYKAGLVALLEKRLNLAMDREYADLMEEINIIIELVEADNEKD